MTNKNFGETLDLNKKAICQALDVDNEKWGLDIEFSDLFTEDKRVKLDTNKTYLIIYQGDVNYTKIICDEALNKKANVIFSLNDEYLATNTAIVKIANNIIEKEKLGIILKIYNNVEDEKLFTGSKQIDEAIFIGNAFDYREVKYKIKCPCKFIEIEDEEE